MVLSLVSSLGFVWLEAVGLAEFFYCLRRIAMLPIDLLVHGLHFFRGEFSREIGKGRAQFWPAIERFLSHQRDCLVGRKVMLVVLKNRQVDGFDWGVGRVAGDDVYLAPVQRPVKQS